MRALEIRIVQIGVIGAELVGEEHALVDDGAAGDRHRVIVGHAPFAPLVDGVGDRLAQDVEPALEVDFAQLLLAEADENLHVLGLGRLDGFAERRVVGRHFAPAEQLQTLARDHFGVDVADDLSPVGFARHEQLADGVFARSRQREAERGGLLDEELVRDLHQDAGAVAHARIGADGAAMFEVAENLQAILDGLVRLLALDIGDEADAAGILVERGVVETLRQARAGIGVGISARNVAGSRHDPAPIKLGACLPLAHRALPPLRPLTYPPRPQRQTSAAVHAQTISRRAALSGRRRRGRSYWAPPVSALTDT